MIYKTLLIILVGLLHSSTCSSAFRDPTQPNPYFKNNESTSGLTNSLKLSSILISGDYKRAIISGRSAKEGDVIFTSIKVLKIFKNSVLISQDKKQRRLILYGISTVDF